jgi:hypothetical protein
MEVAVEQQLTPRDNPVRLTRKPWRESVSSRRMRVLQREYTGTDIDLRLASGTAA